LGKIVQAFFAERYAAGGVAARALTFTRALVITVFFREQVFGLSAGSRWGQSTAYLEQGLTPGLD